jgi:hypothetical protein
MAYRLTLLAGGTNDSFGPPQIAGQNYKRDNAPVGSPYAKLY